MRSQTLAARPRAICWPGGPLRAGKHAVPLLQVRRRVVGKPYGGRTKAQQLLLYVLYAAAGIVECCPSRKASHVGDWPQPSQKEGRRMGDVPQVPLSHEPSASCYGALSLCAHTTAGTCKKPARPSSLLKPRVLERTAEGTCEVTLPDQGTLCFSRYTKNTTYSTVQYQQVRLPTIIQTAKLCGPIRSPL
jgi:hypothetical protein